jgi:hypothetical protein
MTEPPLALVNEACVVGVLAAGVCVGDNDFSICFGKRDLCGDR